MQESRLFSDQKHFVDALPLREPARIRADYLRERERPGFDLRAFVGRNFEESGSVETARRKRVPISPATSATCGRR